MISPENDIKRFFESIGIRVLIKKTLYITGPAARRHIILYTSGMKYPERFLKLMDYYFEDAWPLDPDCCSVILAAFNKEGHHPDTCRICGCSNNNACSDQETGTCWWVQESLCSACATKEEKQAAINQLRTLSNEN
jgi:hypothetical protein